MKQKTKDWLQTVGVGIAILMLLFGMLPGAFVRASFLGWFWEALILGVPAVGMTVAIVLMRPRPDAEQYEQGYEVQAQFARARFYRRCSKICGVLFLVVLLLAGAAMAFGILHSISRVTLLKWTGAVGVPFLMGVPTCSMVAHYWLERAKKDKAAATIPFCKACGYSHVGLEDPSALCPECGKA